MKVSQNAVILFVDFKKAFDSIPSKQSSSK